MEFGIQLYGIDEISKENPEVFFRYLSESGYRTVEPCILLKDHDGFSGKGWTMEDMFRYMPILKAAGLKVRSCHVLTKEPEAVFEQMADLAERYGIRQFVWNCPDTIEKQNYKMFAEVCRAAADRLKSCKAQLLLHNGLKDMKEKIKGKPAYEWLLEECGKKVGAQPDVGWMYAAGIEPESFLWRNAEYIESIHYKDFKRDIKTGVFYETAVGCGDVDIKACFQFARAMEIPQFVDQDTSINDITEDIRNAAAFLSGLTQYRENSRSILCILDTQTGVVQKIREYDKVIEAPNWLSDDDTIIYNSEGKIWRYSITEDKEEMIDTGICHNCNNDHVLSPDEKYIAVSSAGESGLSQIYKVPLTGGEAVLITPEAPSYLHGWSSDGNELAYCAFRMINGKEEVDIYVIPSEGGEEIRLTKESAFNDGPEYSPDGEFIWFNSTRTGLMQIWRMRRDGSEQTQMTFEDQNNWFGHISPDGKKVINLSYGKGGLDANEHLPNMNVEFWIMDEDGQNRKRILSFFGGQGSMNVNSWSKDSRRVAFVMYELSHR